MGLTGNVSLCLILQLELDSVLLRLEVKLSSGNELSVHWMSFSAVNRDVYQDAS